MRKTAACWLAAFGVAFGFIALYRWSTSQPDGAGDVAESSRDSELATFWDLYAEATKRRSRRDYEGAVAFYRDALRLRSGHEDSLYYLGNSLVETGDIGEAVEVFRTLLEVNPDSLRGLSRLGEILTAPFPDGRPDYNEAGRLLERAARLSPEESGPFLRLGRLALATDDSAGALKHLDTAARFGSAEAALEAGNLLYRRQRYEEALEWLGRVLHHTDRERKLKAGGAALEGDASSHDRPMSPTEAFRIRARFLGYWSALVIPDPSEDSPFGRPAVTVPDAGYEVLRSGVPEGLPGPGRWVDYDGDGRPDLSVVGAGAVELFQQRDGHFRRAHVLRSPGAVYDVRWADYDGDGDLDAYAAGEPSRLWQNRTGSEAGSSPPFVDTTAAAGLQGDRRTLSAFWFDCDADGRPDLLEVGGDPPASVRLYRNRGGTRFEEGSRESGLQVAGAVLGAAFGDVDGDGKLDLFVLRRGRDAVLFRNRGDGRFEDSTTAAGLAHVGGNSVAAVFADTGRDGRPDLLVAGYAPAGPALDSILRRDETGAFGPRLFENDGAGRFAAPTTLPGASGTMEVQAVDLDADGWTDFVLATGGWDGRRIEPSRVLINHGGGEFREALLPDLDTPADSRGAAAADLDGDGIPELYLAGVGIIRRIEPAGAPAPN